MGAGADKGLDLTGLLEGLEEQFDLPALAADSSDGGSGKFQMVDEQYQLSLVGFIEHHDAAQKDVLARFAVSR